MANKRELDGLTIQEAQAAAFRAQGMSQSDAYRQAYNVKRARPKNIHERACRLFARPNVKTRVEELLRGAKVEDIDSVGKAFDSLLRLLEKAIADGNYNAAAQLMRQRLQAHGMLRDRLVLSAENLLTDEQLIERLSGGDPEKLAAARLLLGAAEGFPEGPPPEDHKSETRH
jgi:hypothetical protein